FSFNGPSPTVSSTLSLHDALPIFAAGHRFEQGATRFVLVLAIAETAMAEEWAKLDKAFQQLIGADMSQAEFADAGGVDQISAIRDLKSTRLNSSHVKISYAVFCLK